MEWGLALSGGGAKGAAHVGAMRALQEDGLQWSMIGGASAGAIVAGFYAAGMEVPALEDAMRRMMARGRRWLDPSFLGILRAGAQLITGREITLSGLLKGNRLERFFRRETYGMPLNRARLPVCLTAVDINTPRLVLFSSHDIPAQGEDTQVLTHPAIYEGIRASIAIPVSFQPLLAEGMRLVDGGVWEAMPVSALYGMGAEHVIAINVGYSGESRPKVDNLFEIASQSIDLMGFELARCRSQKADVRIDIPTEGVGVFDFNKMAHIMQIGYETTRKALPRIRMALSAKSGVRAQSAKRPLMAPLQPRTRLQPPVAAPRDRRPVG